MWIHRPIHLEEQYYSLANGGRSGQYRGGCTDPERVAFQSQKSENVAREVGLIVGLQSKCRSARQCPIQQIETALERTQSSKRHLIDK